MQEERILKVSFGKSGSGSISASIRIPKSWLDEMGIGLDNREVIMTIQDNKIIIEKVDNIKNKF